MKRIKVKINETNKHGKFRTVESKIKHNAEKIGSYFAAFLQEGESDDLINNFLSDIGSWFQNNNISFDEKLIYDQIFLDLKTMGYKFAPSTDDGIEPQTQMQDSDDNIT